MKPRFCASKYRPLLAAFMASAIVGVSAVPSHAFQTDTAVLQALDKVTARVSTFDAQVNEIVRFGALAIRVRHCDRTPPEERPESTAFVEIDELKPGEEASVLFTGWVFASSPAVHAVEHPVYDVWLLECVNRPPPPEE